MIELGGNIVLTGFKELDRDTMVVVKKIVGSYVKKVSERNPEFQSLSLTLKQVHEREQAEIYEIHANLLAGKAYNSSISERNLMIAIDRVLKKIESTMGM